MTSASDDIDRACALYGFLAAGGDEERMLFTVFRGDPVSKHRARFARGRVYVSSSQSEAERTLGACLRQDLKSEPFRGNVAVGCIFYRRTRQPVDVDNLLKHVLDSANGVLWLDDRQVTALVGILEWDPEDPRTVIVVGQHASTLERDTVVAGVCETCGVPIEDPSWRKKRKRFCSPACNARSRGQDLSEPVPCRQCGAPFKRINSYSVLCSETCRRVWLTGRNRGRAEPRFCEDCGVQLPGRARRCRTCWKKARSRGIA